MLFPSTLPALFMKLYEEDSWSPRVWNVFNSRRCVFVTPGEFASNCVFPLTLYNCIGVLQDVIILSPSPSTKLNFKLFNQWNLWISTHTHSKIYGLNVIFNECIRSSGSSLMKLLLTLPHQSFVTHSAIQPHWPCWFLQATYWTLLSWQPPLLKPVVWDEPLMRLEVKVQIWVQWPLLLINMGLWGLI